MGDKIDVLAAVDRAARELWVTGQPVNPIALDLISARAAIAELIEAEKEYDAADSVWGGERYEPDDYGVHGSGFWRCLDCENESGAGVLNKGVTHEQSCRVAALERAIERRAAALARVGGA